MKEVIQSLEALRDKWADRANFLESLANKNGMDGILSEIYETQAKIIYGCNGELYNVIEEIKDKYERNSPTQ